MTLSTIKKAHLVGIKGVGMTALAEVLQKKGITVTGSDTEEKFFTDAVLAELHIPVIEHFDAKNSADADVVIHSLAYGEQNPEIAGAKAQGVTVLSYPEALGMVTADYRLIPCVGTDGKTTTSAMLTWVLSKTGQSPTAIVGSRMNNFGSNAVIGKSDVFVLEGDEYKDKLQYLHPYAALLTTVNYDHPDFFPDVATYQDVFKRFLSRIPHDGFVVAGIDSDGVRAVTTPLTCRVVSYGIADDARWRAVNIRIEKELLLFDVVHDGVQMGSVSLQMIGTHNVQNALGVIAVADELGVPFEKSVAALAEFKGTARRFEYLGEYESARIYDDYAHTPPEIRATLQGVRQRFPDKIIRVVFHPHTFTRTATFLEEFATSFADANEVIVLDVYGSARENKGEITSKHLVDAIQKHHNLVVYTPTIENAVAHVKESISPRDIIVTMGAGDVWRVGTALAGSILHHT